MLNRPLMSIENNPLMDSPYVQQDDVGVAIPPPHGSFFLLSTGNDFLLSTGFKLLLAG
jgi:hypothetical protein